MRKIIESGIITKKYEAIFGLVAGLSITAIIAAVVILTINSDGFMLIMVAAIVLCIGGMYLALRFINRKTFKLLQMDDGGLILDIDGTFHEYPFTYSLTQKEEEIIGAPGIMKMTGKDKTPVLVFTIYDEQDRPVVMLQEKKPVWQSISDDVEWLEIRPYSSTRVYTFNRIINLDLLDNILEAVDEGLDIEPFVETFVKESKIVNDEAEEGSAF